MDQQHRSLEQRRRALIDQVTVMKAKKSEAASNSLVRTLRVQSNLSVVLDTATKSLDTFVASPVTPLQQAHCELLGVALADAQKVCFPILLDLLHASESIHS